MKGALIVRSFTDDINYAGCGSGQQYGVALGDCPRQCFSFFGEGLRGFWSSSVDSGTPHHSDFCFHRLTSSNYADFWPVEHSNENVADVEQKLHPLAHESSSVGARSSSAAPSNRGPIL